MKPQGITIQEDRDQKKLFIFLELLGYTWQGKIAELLYFKENNSVHVVVNHDTKVFGPETGQESLDWISIAAFYTQFHYKSQQLYSNPQN